MDNLEHLMSAYFHQDWWEEYDGSWHAAVRDFARRSPERVPGLKTEISSLLRRGIEDDEAAELLEGLGNYRDPGSAPAAHVEWLADIIRVLEDDSRAEQAP